LGRPEVVVIDYGAGNLFSVRRGLECCGVSVNLTADPEQILRAQRVVLPGVGAFGNAMRALEYLGLVEVIKRVAENNIPLLGICLGMQLLMDESDEFGRTKGLGLIPGRVVPVPTKTTTGDQQKTPHIDWSAIRPSDRARSWKGTLLEDIQSGDSVYFAHSFMAIPSNETHRIAECAYGGHEISAVSGKKNVVGCQFHPEKSGEVGLKILRRFCGG